MEISYIRSIMNSKLQFNTKGNVMALEQMTPRERLLTALSNRKPDRLPCQVHNWMTHYLNTYLNGMDQWQAYEQFGMDTVIYNAILPVFYEKDQANWQVKTKHLKTKKDTSYYEEIITTPDGQLHRVCAENTYTIFDTEHLIKSKEDFEIFNRYWPAPVSIDATGVHGDKNRLSDRGIMRTYNIAYYFSQGSPWQCLCSLMGTEPAIMAAMDDPEWMHYVLESLLQKALQVIRLSQDVTTDLIEIGGGAGSNTVISPKMFEEFCLPYDLRQNQALQKAGFKTVYHLCGGLMKMMDMVVETGANAIETMTPTTMGGDCDLREASRRWGDKLCFIGGFDQNGGFENGDAADARRLVRECFDATKEQGGYIVSPSDHFFHGNPENLEAFIAEAKTCIY